MSRDRRGRFTAERTTTTSVTERVIVEPPAPPPLPGPGTGRHAFHADPSVPVFSRLLWNPPAGARWAHPAFIADMAACTAAPPRAPAEPFTVPYDETAPVPVITVEVARVPYPMLEEDTLAHEFTELDREALTAVLDGPLELGAP